MAFEVLCLRPEADFARVDALPPASLQVIYGKPDDPTLPQRMKAAAALVIPAVGPKLADALFEGCSLRLVQITGAGVDRLDEPRSEKRRAPHASRLPDVDRESCSCRARNAEASRTLG